MRGTPRPTRLDPRQRTRRKLFRANDRYRCPHTVGRMNTCPVVASFTMARAARGPRTIGHLSRYQHRLDDHALAQGCPDLPGPADGRFGQSRTDIKRSQRFSTVTLTLATGWPRLFPTDERQRPAQFLGTRHIDLGDGSYGARGPFALHYWQPADGRGVLAIAYPAATSTPSTPRRPPRSCSTGATCRRSSLKAVSPWWTR